MNQAEELIKIIDSRIEAYLNKSKILCRLSGKVVDLDKDKISVQLLGDSTVYILPKRSYVNAKIGDFVFIESKINNLSSGIVTDKL